jgi:ferredoxin
MVCGLCRDACPAAVLTGGQWSIAIERDGCLGCGLCAAACPTGALSVDGFAPARDAGDDSRIVLECRRVAEDDRAPGAAAVPCLGGLTTQDLIEHAGSGETTVIVADRGWCAVCPVGGRSRPWQEAVDEARSVLAAVSPTLAGRIVVEPVDMPAANARPVQSALRPDKQVGRRDFLQRLAGMAEPRDPLAESRRVVFGRGLVTPLKREQILAQVAAIASTEGQGMPAALFPAIRVADDCDLHGLCAAVCPTGALRRAEAGGTISLQFDAADCIACGECQRVCPGKALSLWPQGDGAAPHGSAILATRRTAECVGCGGDFVPKDGEDFCPACQKTMDLMQQVATLKLGSPSPRQ